MFSGQTRDRVREFLLRTAEADEAIVGAALTGSQALGHGDRWSDIDLVLAVSGELCVPLNRWTRRLYDDLDARHHWDLPGTGAKVVRVFLLPGWLEVDINFTPETEFGARGPQWQTIFGRERSLEPFPPPDRDTLVGLAWHHALHARICIERRRDWQAEHWISALRDHMITLACLRLGHPATHAKAAHLLPHELTTSLEATLIRSITEPELRRALNAAITALTNEIKRTNPKLAARLGPMLTELMETDQGDPRPENPS